MTEGIETKDWIMIAAIIIGPILAIQSQKFIERFTDRRNRRLQIFQTLMSTRASRVSFDHVVALNLIDIEFFGRGIFGTRKQTKKEKAVTSAWKNYNDLLNNLNPKEQLTMWSSSCSDLFVKLLYEMSKTLGYDFDEVQIKRDCYTPKAHGDLEQDQLLLRKMLLEILDGKRGLPVKQYSEGATTEPENTSLEPS